MTLQTRAGLVYKANEYGIDDPLSIVTGVEVEPDVVTGAIVVEECARVRIVFSAAVERAANQAFQELAKARRLVQRGERWFVPSDTKIADCARLFVSGDTNSMHVRS
jgi:hypothetical protein